MKKIFSFLLFLCLITSIRSQTPPEAKLAHYTGVFVFPEGSVVPDVEVILADSVLSMNSVAGSSVINQVGVDTFYIVEFDGIAIFYRDESNEVIKVHIEAGGYILDGEKKKAEEVAFLRRKQILRGHP